MKSAVAALAAAPVFAWEMSLAGWMIAKGFQWSPAPQSATPSPQPPSMMTSCPVM